MIRLNLLADESKQKIRQQRLYFLFLKTELTLLLIIFIGSTIFFVSEKILSVSVLKFNNEVSKIIKASSNNYGLEVKKINGTLSTVAEIQKGFTPYSLVLKNISTLTPDGVTISYIKINAPTKEIKIRGRAIQRENLLTFESNLKNSPFLTKVDVPMADKLKKTDIDFDIVLGFDPTKL